MASNLHVKIDRMSGRGADASPFYSIHFQNAAACNGRGIDLLLSLSFEDIRALYAATHYIVARSGDSVKVVAEPPGTAGSLFEEIPKKKIPVSTKKFITKEGDIK